MYVVEIFLPLTDNDGHPFPQSVYEVEKRTLMARFGGLTAFTRAPAEGIWKQQTRDDLVIFEVIAEAVDKPWWRAYRERLETVFRQERILIRATACEQL